MEIDNAIFKHLDSFGKERFFKVTMKKFGSFVWRSSKIS